MQARPLALLPLVVVAAVGCKPPPPAPKGLDESAKYMVRNFWADDATFQAGLQGFVNWFEYGDPEAGDPPGKELLGLVPGQEGKTTDAFTIEDLSDEDVAIYPLDAELLDDPGKMDDPSDDVYGPRDIARAAGVVSLAEMDCSLARSEQLLLRPDQHVVFPNDWEAYERTYVTPRATFENATKSGTFTPIPVDLDPYADDFDPTAYADTILITDNIADPKSVIGANLPGYPLNLEFRHGRYRLDIGGEEQELAAFAIVTYNPSAVWGPDGKNALRQSYSVEINLERPGNKTLRMLAVWAEPVSAILPPDDPMVLNYAVNKSQTSSRTLSEICAGKMEIPDEP